MNQFIEAFKIIIWWAWKIGFSEKNINSAKIFLPFLNKIRLICRATRDASLRISYFSERKLVASDFASGKIDFPALIRNKVNFDYQLMFPNLYAFAYNKMSLDELKKTCWVQRLCEKFANGELNSFGHLLVKERDIDKYLLYVEKLFCCEFKSDEVLKWFMSRCVFKKWLGRISYMIEYNFYDRTFHVRSKYIEKATHLFHLFRRYVILQNNEDVAKNVARYIGQLCIYIASPESIKFLLDAGILIPVIYNQRYNVNYVQPSLKKALNEYNDFDLSRAIIREGFCINESRHHYLKWFISNERYVEIYKTLSEIYETGLVMKDLEVVNEIYGIRIRRFSEEEFALYKIYYDNCLKKLSRKRKCNQR